MKCSLGLLSWRKEWVSKNNGNNGLSLGVSWGTTGVPCWGTGCVKWLTELTWVSGVIVLTGGTWGHLGWTCWLMAVQWRLFNDDHRVKDGIHGWMVRQCLNIGISIGSEVGSNSMPKWCMIMYALMPPAHPHHLMPLFIHAGMHALSHCHEHVRVSQALLDCKGDCQSVVHSLIGSLC